MARIAFLTPEYFDALSYVGGGERYLRDLAFGVAETTDRSIPILSFGAETGKF